MIGVAATAIGSAYTGLKGMTGEGWRAFRIAAGLARIAATPKAADENQRTLFTMLHAAGRAGLTLEDWNEQAREAGIGVTRKADLNDICTALLSKGLVRTYGDRWVVAHE